MGDYNGQGNTIKHTPSGADVLAGDVVVVGDKVCMAKSDIADGVEGELSTNGEFFFIKLITDVFAQGIVMYWDVADQEITILPDSGTNKKIGYVTVAAANGDLLALCYLSNNV